MTLLISAPALPVFPATVDESSPLGEAAIFDAAGAPVTTLPDVWGAGELDHQQDFEDMVDVFGWPDLDDFPDGDFSYPVF